MSEKTPNVTPISARDRSLVEEVEKILVMAREGKLKQGYFYYVTEDMGHFFYRSEDVPRTIGFLHRCIQNLMKEWDQS